MISSKSGRRQTSFFPRGIMSLPFRQLYEFGEFRLDPGEKILLCGDAPVELTPKGFELLSLLVENHGRLLEKDELMDKIWTDSFVEESNLTFNIRQLRVVLGDDAHDPKYIKTVRRHGYRFIADVRQISEENDRAVSTATDESAAFQTAETVLQTIPVAAPKTKKTFSLLLPAVIILLTAALVTGFWFVKNRAFQPITPVLAAPFSTEKLSTNGKVVNAKLSP